MHNFRNLEIWQLSKALALKVYQVCEVFPPTELYGLTSQIKRPVISISFQHCRRCGKGTPTGILSGF
ncbi:MAG: four helix bundle protein [Owenweeksia sp.]|nr:four helix bundle protein [Owenweeksia sp.]